MSSEFHLIFHNVESVIAAIVMFAMGFFLILNNRHSRPAMVLAFLIFWVEVFPISHVIGVNLSDPYQSRLALMFNLFLFMVGPAIVHLVLAVIKKEKERMLVLVTAYAAGIFFIVFFIINPDFFLLPSVPKMYFPNYYNPGILNWTRLAFPWMLCLPYAIYELINAYRNSTDAIFRKQMLFFAAAILVGFSFGYIPNLLVNDIQVDPAVGMFMMSLFVVPALIGGVKYELFNIKVVARQAFLYSVAVVVIGAGIALLNNANIWINQYAPGIPFWLIPLVSSILAMSIGVLVWRTMRENDILKSEFITTVTHKFRTPLTHIKWASENLVASNPSEDQREQISYIQSANSNLVELTDLLMNVSESESRSYDYDIKRRNMNETIEEVLISLKDQIRAKNIDLVKDIGENNIANYDAARIRFIIQTFIENAVHYSAAGSSIMLRMNKDEGHIKFSVTDNGIGITAEEMPLLFSKFYRGKEARQTDTEGMGIGLFIAKGIIEKHGGKIWAESAGRGQGSTFIFTLPAAK